MAGENERSFPSRILFAAFILLLFGSLPLALSRAETTVTVTATVAERTTEATISFEEGGSMTHTTAASTTVDFAFPSNFYTEDLVFRANSYATTFFETDKSAPSGKSFIGKVYDFDLFTTAGTVSTTSKEITITIGYTDSDVSGIDESTLAPYRHDGASWQEISGATVDEAGNQVTFSTASFSSFALFGEAVSSFNVGGGGTITTPAGASFSGWAYPGRPVVLLLAAQELERTTAEPDGTFQMTVTGFSVGTHVFSLYGQDLEGRISTLFTLPLEISGALTTSVREILLAPTLDSDKIRVRQGDAISFFGQSAPEAGITLEIEGEQRAFLEAVSGAEGVYLVEMDTASLARGLYEARARVSLGGRNVSGLSGPVGFEVGEQNVPREERQIPLLPGGARGDLNEDNRVNLVDFSILIFWLDRPNPPAHLDLDGNGVVTLKDFSIMSYYWTG